MLGDVIKALRDEKKIQQRDLASFLEVKPSTVSNWENNSRRPDFEHLKKIADFFDVSIDFLLERTTIKKMFQFENSNGNFQMLVENSPVTFGYIAENKIDEMSDSLLKSFNTLDTADKARIIVMIDDMNKSKTNLKGGE